MKIAWTEQAWSEYVAWQTDDMRIVKRINHLVRDALRDPYTGIGKPEQLRANLSGYWSRRITDEHRLVYSVHDDHILVIQCRYHY